MSSSSYFDSKKKSHILLSFLKYMPLRKKIGVFLGSVKHYWKIVSTIEIEFSSNLGDPFEKFWLIGRYWIQYLPILFFIREETNLLPACSSILFLLSILIYRRFIVGRVSPQHRERKSFHSSVQYLLITNE